ncbi:ATP-binding protein [Myxococcota bacterium]|nr:ATP-binding protein [Myxococcota bacterium]
MPDLLDAPDDREPLGDPPPDSPAPVPPRLSLSVRLLVYLLFGTALVMAAFQLAAEAYLRQVSRALEADGRELAQQVLERSSEVLDQRIRDYYLAQTVGEANRLDAMLAEVGRSVSMVADAASQQLAQPSGAAVEALEWTEFNDGDGRPADLRRDPDRGLAVSWAWPVYKAAPGTAADPAEVARVARLRDLMVLTARHHPTLKWVYVGLSSGLFFGVPGNGGFEPGYDPRSRPWYRGALGRPGSMVWSPVYVDALTRRPTVTCSRTFGGRGGRIGGVAAADLSLTTVQEWLGAIGSDGVVALLVDAGGKVVSGPDTVIPGADWEAEVVAPDLDEGDDPGLRRAAAAIRAGDTGLERVSYRGSGRFLAYAPLPTVGWRLAVLFPGDRLRDLRDESRSIIGQSFDTAATSTAQRIEDLRQGFVLALIAACILMMAVVGAILTFRLTRPIKRMIRDIQAISAGDLARELPAESEDEIGQLARAFNAMNRQLRRTRDQLRENNRTLEIKVEGRTRELASRNLELNRLYREVEQAYLKLKDAQSQLIHQERMASLGQLVAGIAHEINNPVNFLINAIRPLRGIVTKIRNVLHLYEQTEGLPPEECHRRVQDIRRYKEEVRFDRILRDADSAMDLIRNGADRTGQIVQNLRTFSRTDQVETRQTDLAPALDVTLSLLAHMIKGRIAVHRDYQPCDPIECNPGQINQVFMNLLGNAAQAIEGAGDVWIELTQDGDWVRVKIRDNGCGIPEENLYRIFEPFFTTKDAPHGTGLGLSISLNIIQKHGGTIEVRSEVGVGTEFTVSLPIRPLGFEDEQAPGLVVGVEDPAIHPFEATLEPSVLVRRGADGGGPREP